MIPTILFCSIRCGDDNKPGNAYNEFRIIPTKSKILYITIPYVKRILNITIT